MSVFTFPSASAVPVNSLNLKAQALYILLNVKTEIT
jgi:hypothetical protein